MKQIARLSLICALLGVGSRSDAQRGPTPSEVSILQLRSRASGVAHACGTSIAYERVTARVLRSSAASWPDRVSIDLSCTRRMRRGTCVVVHTIPRATGDWFSGRLVPQVERWEQIPCSSELPASIAVIDRVLEGLDRLPRDPPR